MPPILHIYVLAKFLDIDGFVKVDEYLKCKGQGAVYAIGGVPDAELSLVYPRILPLYCRTRILFPRMRGQAYDNPT